MVRLKDKEYLKAKIKITELNEIYKEGCCYSQEPRLYCITIDKGWRKTSTSFSANKKGFKEMIKFIEKEI